MASKFIEGPKVYKYQTYIYSRKYSEKYKLHQTLGHVKLAVQNAYRYDWWLGNEPVKVWVWEDTEYVLKMVLYSTNRYDDIDWSVLDGSE